jgi:hypothetical protein
MCKSDVQFTVLNASNYDMISNFISSFCEESCKGKGETDMSNCDNLTGPQGQSILRQLYPSAGDADCPMVADAVDNYLNTGQIVPVQGTLGSNYTIDASWQIIQLGPLISLVQGMGHDNHVVVRGTRPITSPMTQTHFFVVANCHGLVYVFDANTGDRTTDIHEYYQRQEFNQLHYTQNYRASVAFTP